MTNPAFPMPYVVQFQAKDEGGRAFEIPPTHRLKGSATNHYLKPGTYQIQVTWDGRQAVDLSYQKGRFWVIEPAVEAHPEGVNNRSARSSKMITVTVPEGFGDMVIRLQLASTSPDFSESNVSQNNTATMIVYPTMNQGEAII